MSRRPGLLLPAAAFLAVLAAFPAAASAVVEIRAGFGGWTLSPFHPLIETRSEEVVQAEFDDLLESALPDWLLSPVRADIDTTSSGRSLYAEVWVPLGRGRFAVGARGDLFRFRVPFTASATETVQIIGLPLAEIHGTAAGTVELDGFGASLLGRWTAVSTRLFDLALRAGDSVFPFRGRVATDLQAVVRTPLGDYAAAGRWDRTIDEIREGDNDVPSLVVSPAVGFEAGLRLAPGWKLFAGVTVSHGTFYSAGVALAL